jgi:phthiocerol/phenolphthiocerol synthesis type-I polyketide synthase C
MKHLDKNVEPAQAEPAGANRQDIEEWLVERLSERLKVPPGEIDVTVNLARYNLDSMAAVTVVGELEEWLGRSLSPTLFYEHSCIRAVADHLAGGARP